jgi:hypothetical protein
MSAPSSTPKVAIRAALLEARALAAFLEKFWLPTKGVPGISQAGPGVRLEMAEELRALATRAWSIQAELVAKPRDQGQPKNEARARFVLGELRAALGHVLSRADATGREQLRVVRQAHPRAPRSAATLAEQLTVFAALADRHRGLLDQVPAFDTAYIAEAREHARKARSYQADRRPPELAATRLDRDRLLRDIRERVLAIRAAARFVFRAHPELSKLAGSAREREQVAASRRRAKATRGAAEAAEREAAKAAAHEAAKAAEREAPEVRPAPPSARPRPVKAQPRTRLRRSKS